MLRDFQVLFQHRELLMLWTLREIRVRYKQSLLGGAWAVLQPLSLMVVFTVVFTLLVKMPSDGIPYPIFSYSALLLWTFFSTSISFGVPSLTQNMNLVSKIYFPREVIPFASAAAALVDFLVASMVFIVLMLIYQVPIGSSILWIPVILVTQTLLILGVVLAASAVNVFYRDVRFVVPLVLQLWMYATPIIYPASLIPDRFRSVYMLNPMAGLVEAYREVALRGELANWNSLGMAATISVMVFVFGYRYFKRVEGQFADVI